MPLKLIHYPRSIFHVALVMVGVVALWMTGQQLATAQTGSTNITAINVVSTTATQAVIQFSYTAASITDGLQYRISYGKTATYGINTEMVALGSATGSAATTLSSLTAATNYHYIIQLYNNNASPTLLFTSSDRTFTTYNGDSGTSPLIITNIKVNCSDIRCEISFLTSKRALAEIAWDSATHASGSFDDYPSANRVAETTASDAARALAFPTASQLPLVSDTTYYYRLRATAEDGSGSFSTVELSFKTSPNGVDHIFSTGSCTDPVTSETVEIGSCSSLKKYCSPEGTLIEDCGSICGYVCQAGTTCSQGGQCLTDPVLNPNATNQCNKSSCYDANGRMITPALGSCYNSWSKCNANTILKVRRDRGCNMWLTCGTSLQTEPSANLPAENLCLNLSACNSLNSQGQCNHYLAPGQCSNNALRFCISDLECLEGGTCNLPPTDEPTRSLKDLTLVTPLQVADVANLSGNVTAGLDWAQQGGQNVIQGWLPWQIMRQLGGNGMIKNGDLEGNVPSDDPWVTAPLPFDGVTPMRAMYVDFENRDSSSNHILMIDPITQVESTTMRCSGNTRVCATTADCPTSPAETCQQAGVCSYDGTTPCVDNTNCAAVTGAVCQKTQIIKYSGAATSPFSASPAEYYYAEARIRATGASPTVRMQFGFKGYTAFSLPDTDTFVDVAATSAWQRVTLGPIKGMSGETRLAFVCADNANCASFQVDDVQVKPVLQVNTNPQYITPSCRLYPKSDAPACDYTNENGITYKGWRGYCLEHDSQTGTCLSWWPVDLIKGESNIFGSEQQAGYQDRTPLYLCAEAAGGAGKNEVDAAGVIGQVGYSFGEGYEAYNNQCYTDDILDIEFTSDLNAMPESPGDPQTCTPTVRPAHGLPMAAIDSIEFKFSETFWKPFIATKDDFINGTSTTRTALKFEDEETVPTIVSLYAYHLDNVAVNNVPAGFSGTYNAWIVDRYWRLNDSDVHLMRAAFLFNIQTGRLEHQLLDGRSRIFLTMPPPTYTSVIYHTHEICNKLVQVVSPTGDNQAFAGRINSSSYSVTDLKYIKSTDLAPFGGALAPDKLGDVPTQWPLMTVEKPDYVNREKPGQARAGNPYACYANCQNYTCTTAPTDTTGLCSGSGSGCQSYINPTTGESSPGQCTGVDTTAGLVASGKGDQKFNPAACIEGQCASPDSCLQSTTNACLATKTVVGTGTTAISARADATSKCGIVTGAFGTEKYTTIACNGNVGSCAGTSAYFRSYTENPGALSCTKNGLPASYLSCLLGGCVCTSTGVCSTCTASGACTTGAQTYTQAHSSSGVCTTAEDCTALLAKPTENSTVNEPLNDYYAQEHIKRLFAQSYGIWTYQNGQYNLDKDSILSDLGQVPPQFKGWTPPSILCQDNPAYTGEDKCVTQTQSCSNTVQVTGVGTSTTAAAAQTLAETDARNKCLNGVACDGTDITNTCTTGGTKALYDSVTTACGQTAVVGSDITYTCTGTCKSTAQYTRVFTQPLTSKPAKYIRPSVINYATGADYCAIPPEITNAKFLTGTATTVTITGGSGSVGIKFNTTADVEQVPLKNIIIDWGDGQDSFAFPFAPRNDPSKPHIFSHVYVLNRADAINCPVVNGRATCTFHIKISVEDNWGWCNEATRESADKCQRQGLGNGQYDSTNWYNTGLTVKVEP